MTIPTLFATASGLMVDLLHPSPRMIVWEDIAEHLAKEPRFNGATPGTLYSVAEHCCRGADALLYQGQSDAAAAFLIHDAPEAYLKDEPTPKKHALAQLMQELGGGLTRQHLALTELTRRWERAIHSAAGLIYPLPEAEQRIVHHIDRVMLATEWRDLMPPSASCPFDEVPLPEMIKPWPWETARIGYMHRCRALLPALRKVEASA